MSMCITKRKDGRFMGRFAIGYNTNGKMLYQYVYGQTYEVALKKLQIGMEIESRFLSDRNISVAEAYDEWLAAIVNRVKKSTYVNYCTKFQKHILPEFGNILCSDITSTKINVFINRKLSEGFSASYVRDIFTVFKAMLKFAQEEHDIHISLRNVVLPRGSKKKDLVINNIEQKKLVNYLKSHMDLTSLGVMISLFMGLRIGELCGLMWSDIDFQSGVMCVKRAVQRIGICSGNKKTKVIISTPKSSSSLRVIAIPDMIMRYLKQLKSSGFILSNTDKPIEPRTFQNRYKKILQQCNMQDHNFHQLRHTFATNCIQNGFDAKTLSVVLGHKNVDITLNRYIHPDNAHERKLMNNMSMLFQSV